MISERLQIWLWSATRGRRASKRRSVSFHVRRSKGNHAGAEQRTSIFPSTHLFFVVILNSHISSGSKLALFAQALGTLKTLTEAQFDTTVEQDDLTNKHATSLAQKEREMEVYKRELHHELAQKVSEREVYQQNSDDTIAKLRAEIEDMEKQSTLKRSQLERHSRAEGLKAAEKPQVCNGTRARARTRTRDPAS